MKQLQITDINDEPFLTIPIDLPDNMTPEETDVVKRLIQTGIRGALVEFGQLRRKEG